MQLKQYYLGCLSHASYMIADERARVAAVVDPQRDVDQYVQDAAANSWEIRYVILTHFHADFLAGHIELRDRTGATICLGARGAAQYEFRAVADGDVIELGDVRLSILETPGHTPEGISIVVYDSAKSQAPYAVLTGDTLFIGDVGRPDLLASIGVTADELADMLYDSLREKLLTLPDATLVYPAHGAGSMCGRNLSTETVSTIGEQRRFNYALQPMSRDEFKRLVTAEQAEAPQYFSYDAVLNRQERPSLEASMKTTFHPLDLDRVLQLQAEGAQLLDVRDAIDFEGAHLAGALNLGLRGKYATWCGTVLDRNTPIVIVADPGSEEEAVVRLGRIGFDNVAGYLQGGMQAVEKRPDLMRATPRVTALALSEQLQSNAPPQVLDVRSEKEWRAGHIEGSLNIPLSHLEERLDELPAVPLAVHCEGGYRSAIAVSILERRGRSDAMDLVGGYKAWAASKLPMTAEAAPQ